MEKLVYVDRRNTNCNKWDGQQKMFGEEGLHAMWVADMDFRVPECVVSALDRKSTRLNSSHIEESRMPSSA